eukprot:CAMPEP_0196996446 /NCGR_PEP_ID=MMETSP1380-20130617/2317_1 /TAXON_ID=5936 /ORGANISM="Euplotes crassus, Strain CT5" /LENGTH=386 /DNA_ID=CAMNT_0042412411 /DNA_START=58 /DNA_END=1218 /DNA_ORIENTATION=+
MEKLDHILMPLGLQLKNDKPKDLRNFTLNWLRETYGDKLTKNENQRLELEYLRKKVPELESHLLEGSSKNIPALKDHFDQFDELQMEEDSDSSETSSDDDDVIVDENFLLPKPVKKTVEEALREIESETSRISVSAEVYGEYNKRSSFKPVSNPKPEDTCERLRARLTSHWMFKCLEAEDMDTLVDAMQEEVFTAGDTVVKEGDKGNKLYIVDNGSFNCIKENYDGSEKLLKVYNEGEMFGELALIYNCDRTATVYSCETCKAFSLDRQTFNHIISGNTIERNERYLKMLGNVPILKTLDKYEKSRILDVCDYETYNDGDYIIREGDTGEDFYILLKGDAVATKSHESYEEDQKVKEYTSGDYFGERALIKNTPRAANIIATGNCK